jgi:hypothetical protein
MHRRLLASPQAPLFALIFACYAYFYQAGGWNQNSRFDLTRAVVEHGAVSIDWYELNTGDKSIRDGVTYCDKAPGVSWLAAPAWAVIWSAHGRPRFPSPDVLAAGAYAATVSAVALPSAIAAIVLFGLLLLLGLSRPWAAGTTLAYSLGTLAWPYSTLLYGHQLVAALHLIAFATLASMRRGAAEVKPWRLAVVGAFLGFGVAVEYSAVLIGLPLMIYALAVLRPRSTLVWIFLGALVPVAALLLYHDATAGGPFTLPYAFSTQVHRHEGWFMGLVRPDFAVLRALTVSERRGLFVSAPWLVVAVPGIALLIRRRAYRAEALACAAAFLGTLWLNISLVDWDGGRTLGPRYLVPALPFLAIGAAGLVTWVVDRPQRWLRRGAVTLFGLLVAISMFLMLAGTAVQPEVPEPEARPFAGYVLPRFLDGRLGVSTQSIDRRFEDYGADEEAWNLGDRFGLTGKASLAPLGIVVAGAALWLFVLLRGGGPGPDPGPARQSGVSKGGGRGTRGRLSGTPEASNPWILASAGNKSDPTPPPATPQAPTV